MIKRYDPAVKKDGKFSGMWDMEDGEFVRYEDLAAELATLRSEVKMLREALEGIMKEDQTMTGGGMCPNILGPCHRIAKEALK